MICVDWISQVHRANRVLTINWSCQSSLQFKIDSWILLRVLVTNQSIKQRSWLTSKIDGINQSNECDIVHVQCVRVEWVVLTVSSWIVVGFLDRVEVNRSILGWNWWVNDRLNEWMNEWVEFMVLDTPHHLIAGINEVNMFNSCNDCRSCRSINTTNNNNLSAVATGQSNSIKLEQNQSMKWLHVGYAVLNEWWINRRGHEWRWLGKLELVFITNWIESQW